MAAAPGRDLRISYNSAATGGTFTAIAGAQTDGFTITREGIPITDKDDEGVQKMLAETGVWGMEANVEGVLLDTKLLTLAMNAGSTTFPRLQIEASGFGTITGNFYLGNFQVNGEQGANPITFTAQLQSSGTMSFTAT